MTLKNRKIFVIPVNTWNVKYLIKLEITTKSLKACASQSTKKYIWIPSTTKNRKYKWPQKKQLYDYLVQQIESSTHYTAVSTNQQLFKRTSAIEVVTMKIMDDFSYEWKPSSAYKILIVLLWFNVVQWFNDMYYSSLFQSFFWSYNFLMHLFVNFFL